MESKAIFQDSLEELYLQSVQAPEFFVLKRIQI